MIAWTDIESTDFDERKAHLLEVAVVVTDDELNEVAATSVVCKPVGLDVDQMIEQMPPATRAMHTKNGLLAEVRATGMRRHEAEVHLVNFTQAAFEGVPYVKTHKCTQCKLNETTHLHVEGLLVCASLNGSVYEPATEPAIKHTPLAGSTIGFDRRWLHEHMPQLEGLFSYRSIDVSSMTELTRRWAKEVYDLRAKPTDEHRALPDIRGSIELLRYYRTMGFVGHSPLGDHIRLLKKLEISISR